MLRLTIFLALVASGIAVCPRFDTVVNLNLPQFAGRWNIHDMIRTVQGEPEVRCLHVELSSNDWTHEPATVSTILGGQNSADESELYQEMTSTVPTFSRPGRWTLDNNGTQTEVGILAAAYLEYSLAVTCIHRVEENLDDIDVLFMSRSGDSIPQGVIENYIGLLKEDYQIDISRFYHIVHSPLVCGDSE